MKKSEENTYANIDKGSRRKFVKYIAVNTSGDDTELRERWKRFDEFFIIYLFM